MSWHAWGGLLPNTSNGYSSMCPLCNVSRRGAGSAWRGSRVPLLKASMRQQTKRRQQAEHAGGQSGVASMMSKPLLLVGERLDLFKRGSCLS